jgi:hypothetical protein
VWRGSGQQVCCISVERIATPESGLLLLLSSNDGSTHFRARAQLLFAQTKEGDRLCIAERLRRGDWLVTYHGMMASMPVSPSFPSLLYTAGATPPLTAVLPPPYLLSME